MQYSTVYSLVQCFRPLLLFVKLFSYEQLWLMVMTQMAHGYENSRLAFLRCLKVILSSVIVKVIVSALIDSVSSDWIQSRYRSAPFHQIPKRNGPSSVGEEEGGYREKPERCALRSCRLCRDSNRCCLQVVVQSFRTFIVSYTVLYIVKQQYSTTIFAAYDDHLPIQYRGKPDIQYETRRARGNARRQCCTSNEICAGNFARMTFQGF